MSSDVNATPRFNLSSFLAACIVAVALIAAALIVAHRPVAAVALPETSIVSARPVGLPPIAQESAQEQFRAQVLAAPTLHTFLYNHQTYTLADVKVTQVIYDAKEDNFTILYDWIWQPAMPSDGPHGNSSTLTNDGYGHYYGAAVLSPEVGSGQNADITIK